MNRYKVALISICLNKPYWPFIGTMFESARKFFLKNHDVDFFVWSDMPTDTNIGATIIPTEPMEWPMPTLHRYHLFLQQKEKLYDYDYIFYCDADMLFVSRVGDEILGDGLTCAQHPMYALGKMYIPPYEPNQKSASFIPRPGRVITENGSKRFMPVYAAGGFQGGRSDVFIKAMEEMKDLIDEDFSNNYVPIWNDETAWNKYLFLNPPSIVLSPSYVFPDSLIKNYYQKVWKRAYVPKLVTITKKFTQSKEGGLNLATTLQNL